jgi:2-aminoadipate transaminase
LLPDPVPPASECINLRVGQPSPNGMLPLDLVRKASAAKLAENDPEYLQYGNIYGYPKVRESVCKFLTKRYGFPIKLEHLMMTNGNTGALALILSIFTSSNDLVFAEEPTYFLAKSIFKDFKLRLEQIVQDKDGLDVDALEKRLQSGEIPKLLYLIPTAHNPSGRTMPAERRMKLQKLSVQYKFLIVSDEVYQMLTFPHITPPPSMGFYDTDGTILVLGTFSKILCPGIRVGWIQAHPPLLEKLVLSGQLDSSGGLNPVGFGTCEKAIDLGLLEPHVDWVRGELWRRYSTLRDGLVKHLPPGVTFEEPQGGYFCIVRLPDGINAADVLPLAKDKHKVQFLPGSFFSQTMDQYMRLSFSYYSSEDLGLAAQRLGDAIREYLSTHKPTTTTTNESPNKKQKQ